MRKFTGVFLVFFIAIAAVVPAHADIASTTYVGEEISGKEDTANKTTTVRTATALATATDGDTKYATEKAVRTAIGDAADALEGKLGSLAKKSTVTSDDITDGAVTNAKIADATIEKGKLSTTVQASLDKADTALQAHQDISGKQDVATAVTHTADTAVGDSTHPVYVTDEGVVTRIDKVAAVSAADTATTATNAKKICSGSTCAAYVDIWVE